MAEKDNELVTIHLDEARQYRDKESWLVTTIGPGNVKVRRETAQKWGLTPVGTHKAADESKPDAAAKG